MAEPVKKWKRSCAKALAALVPGSKTQVPVGTERGSLNLAHTHDTDGSDVYQRWVDPLETTGSSGGRGRVSSATNEKRSRGVHRILCAKAHLFMV